MSPFLSHYTVPPTGTAGLIAHQTLLGGWLGDDGLDTLPPAAPAALVPAPHAPSHRQINELRALAMHLHRDRDRLNGWDRILVKEMVKWRRAPSAWEAAAVADLAERAFWRSRDGTMSC